MQRNFVLIHKFDKFVPIQKTMEILNKVANIEIESSNNCVEWSNGIILINPNSFVYSVLPKQQFVRIANCESDVMMDCIALSDQIVFVNKYSFILSILTTQHYTFSLTYILIKFNFWEMFIFYLYKLVYITIFMLGVIFKCSPKVGGVCLQLYSI